MDENLIANSSVVINAASTEVWNALVDPDAIRQFMFGTEVVADWREGSPIFWRGEWQGKPYEDKGMILELDPGRMMRYSHFSPLSGLPDKPESYHNVTIELSGEGARTVVTLSQDNNPTEQAREHSAKNWGMMLASLKEYLER